VTLLFPEKEAKSVVVLRRKPARSDTSFGTQFIGMALLFPEKEAKSVVLLRRKPQLDQTLTLNSVHRIGLFFFQKKKQKA
jgi:hypothetical protein